MKIKINKKEIFDLAKSIRHCGYAEFKDQQTGQISFIRRLGPYFYPRFHLYFEKETAAEIILTLHLDQKKPSYPGQHAHSGEYDSELVKKEVIRIKTFINDAN